MEALFFWLFAVGLVVSALAVVLNRNPIASALCLVTGFVFLAGLFVTLEAFFMAVVQIIVYAGAVMVLFLFIIMLLDLKAEQKTPVPWMKLGFSAFILSIIGFFINQAILTVPNGDKVLHWGTTTVTSEVKEMGILLFTKYLLPFEVTAVLLLVATVGVVLLSKKDLK
jgi:NADH-quinone oxidoreductase subunit J